MSKKSIISYETTKIEIKGFSNNLYFILELS